MIKRVAVFLGLEVVEKYTKKTVLKSKISKNLTRSENNFVRPLK